MTRPQPARLKIKEKLRDLISKSDTSQLPSIRTLAALTGVSATTVWKEIKRFEKEKLLFTRWGHNIMLNRKSRVTGPQPHVHNGVKWQQIRERIKSDIRCGFYLPGKTLPSKKHLMLRMQISFVTLSKALDSLCETGQLIRRGSKFIVQSSPLRTTWRPRIVLIGSGNRPGVPKIESEREREFYHFLTIEAESKRVSIEYITYNDWKGSPCFLNSQGRAVGILPCDDSVLGYIVSSWHIKNLSDCLFSLTALQKPLSVWIENPSFFLPGNFRKCTFFNIGYSPQPGKKMGDFLLKLGHKEIAYISPFHHNIWSQERLRGLIDSFSVAGTGCKVHPLIAGNAQSEWSFVDQISQKENLEELLCTKKLREKIPVYFQNRFDQFRSEGIRILRDVEIIKTMKKPVDFALRNNSISAIVAANDLCALLILDYLRSKEVSVTSDISVAGFDNTFEGLIQGLTSYSFNTRSLVRSMLDNITDYVYHPGKKEAIRYFEGEVVERFTTRTACR